MSAPDMTGAAALGRSGGRRIVVVGGGIAGLEVATRLGQRLGRPGRAEVVLVDNETAHVWKPMLRAVAAGTSDSHREQLPYVVQASRNGFSYWPGTLAGQDRGRKVLRLASLPGPDGRDILGAREIGYDVLVPAVGSRANDYGTSGIAEHCHLIDSRAQADVFNWAARAEMLRSLAENREMGIAIVGGGSATGIDLAAELMHLLEAAATYGAGDMRARARLTLIESGPRLLTPFPERSQEAATRRLSALGVEIRCNARVSEAREDGFRLQDGGSVPASLRVRAAGVRGSGVPSELDGLDTNRNHQLLVGTTLQTTGDPAVFALGDCASLMPPGEERPLPATAQVAHQQAQHLIRHLPDWLEGRPMQPLAYRDLGSLVSLGPYGAYGSLGDVGLFRAGFVRGRLAQAGHVRLRRSHQARLHGVWRGTLNWLVDRLAGLVAPRIRVD